MLRGTFLSMRRLLALYNKIGVALGVSAPHRLKECIMIFLSMPLPSLVPITLSTIGVVRFLRCVGQAATCTHTHTLFLPPDRAATLAHLSARYQMSLDSSLMPRGVEDIPEKDLRELAKWFKSRSSERRRLLKRYKAGRQKTEALAARKLVSARSCV